MDLAMKNCNATVAESSHSPYHYGLLNTNIDISANELVLTLKQKVNKTF